MSTSSGLTAVLREIERASTSSTHRGRLVCDLIAWWLQADPLYRSRIRRIWRWQDWPGRWGPDRGIDLVVELHDGTLWAVQVKGYSQSSTVSKDDLDSFLSESATADFAFRLLVATTDKLTGGAPGVLERSDKPVGLVMRAALEDSAVNWPTLGELQAGVQGAAPKPLAPREDQRVAARNIARALVTGGRAQVRIPCGVGKTLIAQIAARQLRAQRTLVLVPSLSLAGQTLSAWARNDPALPPFLAVCSDSTVGEDERRSAAELGVPCTTDPELIARFLQQPGPALVVATYQSALRLAEAQQLCAVPFDLVIADEAHRCAGKVDGNFGAVLREQVLLAHRRLFLTATPVLLSGAAERAARTADDLFSMNDPAVFGPLVYEQTFGEAVAAGLLCDYRLLAVGASSTEAARLFERRALGADGVDAEMLATAVALIRSARQHGLRRVLSFHSRVARAKAFTEALQIAWHALPEHERPDGSLIAEYVSGRTSTADRRQALLRLSESGSALVVVASAQCLSEGVDVPAVDAVVFADPKDSQIATVQAIGRVLRLDDTKVIGTILVPVVLGPDDDPASALSQGRFAAVWRVVRALRAHDARLAEDLDAIRRQMGRHAAAASCPAKVTLDLPGIQDVSAFTAEFAAVLVEESTSSVQATLGALERYVQQTGKVTVRFDFVDDTGFPLGVKLHRICEAQRAGTLPEGARLAVERVAPGFAWRTRRGQPAGKSRRRWPTEVMLQVLAELAAQSPGGWIQQRTVVGGVPVGLWLRNRIAAKRRGALSPEQDAALAAIAGLNWPACAAPGYRGSEPPALVHA